MSGIDWRALCEELAGWIERATRHYIRDPEVLIRARTALAQPEPVGPTDLRDETLLVEADACFLYGEGKYTASPEEVVAFARRVILAGQRYAHPTPQPIPVSERLPEPHDLSPGKPQCCWCWDEPEWSWRLAARGYLSPGDLWLPYSAIADVSDRQPAADA